MRARNRYYDRGKVRPEKRTISFAPWELEQIESKRREGETFSAVVRRLLLWAVVNGGSDAEG